MLSFKYSLQLLFLQVEQIHDKNTKKFHLIFTLGCSEMLMANAVMEEAAVTAGKEARAMESFANALRNMPAIIAENGGYDSAQLVSELRALHKQGNKTAGLGKQLV